MTTEVTRALITALFSSMEQEGFGENFLASLADDVHWTATGDSPLSGEYVSKKAYFEQVLIPLRERLGITLYPILDRCLVDGDWATVLFHTEKAIARNGVDFSMQYCWLMRIEGDKIVRVIGFYNQKKMSDLFAKE
jgi:uncharacterized protein